MMHTAVGTSPKATKYVSSICVNGHVIMWLCVEYTYAYVCVYDSVLGMCMCTLYGPTDHDS